MLSDDSEDEVDWVEVQRTLRNQLKPYGSNRCVLNKTFEHHKQRLIKIAKRTALMGESNSALIIGPRGCGKSALVESVIEELLGVKSIKNSIILIYLNGLIHTDDNIALKDIVRQLHVENVEEKAVGSFSEKLAFLLETLRSGSKQSKSLMFVLDEFDLFCNHRDQKILYTLFDVAQSLPLPVCVFGLSCQPGILSKLENRVRSRFSNQIIYHLESLKFSEYVSIAKQVLSLPTDFSASKFRKNWNANVEDILEMSSVQEILRKYFHTSCSVRDLKHFLVYPVSKISSLHPKFEPGDFIDAFSFYARDPKSAMLQGLSILEISLIIAMMHLTELYEGEPFNFEMVYHEYKKFLQKKMSLQNLDKAVVMKALENLLAIELVKEVSESSRKTLKRFIPVRLLLEPNQIKEALTRYPNLSSELQQWASSSILD